MDKIRITKHGYRIYPVTEWEKFPLFFCKDDKDALEDLRELILEGETIVAVNKYDTFYGCSWGDWLIKGIGDIADCEVTERWDAWGNCAPFPSRIKLTPKTKK